ncbi:MAG: SpoIIE family protein phosphatase [Candidatus Eisenbacteria bacterium]
MSRARILVVDDDASHRRAVSRVLDASCDVVAAASPGAALEHAAEQRFDVALLDIRMPGMDGFDLMGELKIADPELDVILMTGSVTDTDQRMSRAIREKAFFFLQKPFQRDVLLALVGRCLELRRLAADKRTHLARIERELAAARSFQESLLPARSGSTGPLMLASLFEPSREMGGDFFDWEPIPGPGLALLVADVAGKGAAAAMLTGMVKQAWRSFASEAFSPAVALQRIFATTRLFPDQRHLTAFSGRLDAGGDMLEYIITAGHPPAFLLRADGEIELLDASAEILHPAFPTWHFEQRVTAFEPGDRLFVYTDGLLESSRASDGDIFGLDRLQEALAEAPRTVPAVLAEGVRESLRRFQEGRPAEDDLAIVVVGRG